MGCCSSSGTDPLLLLSTRDGTDISKKPKSVVRSIGSIRESYTIIKTLGSGSLGNVFLVKDKRSGLERTAKELIKSMMNQNELEGFFHELSLLKSIDHPSIMRIYEIIETTTRIYIISEYLSGGQLFEKLVRCERITERISARYLCYIILALNYCHKLNIIHRDIKPENLLFESDAPDAHLKIIDFGISCISNFNDNDLQVSVGAVNYMAPERFKGQVSIKSDIWSAGVILYTMLSGRLPFQADTDAKTAKMICQDTVDMHNTVWRNISTEAKNLIIHMLKKDPKDRPTAEEILSDPWMISYTRSTISDNPIDSDALKNLEKFNARNKLEKSIFSFISNQVMGTIETKKLTNMFLSLDKNGDGTLSLDEIEEGYDALGIPAPVDLNDLIKKIDGEDDGSINYTEFIAAAQDWSNIAQRKELEIVFKIYDIGGDGTLSLEELKQAIPGIKDSEWADFLSKADLNGDGLISLEELKNYLTSNTQ
ncbi:hypothetical protein SteCoe_17088 [Stentor coeruleus]|uniref:Calmodulin n=1 Tax=Stentor coeruleus TaxID=5963 RepID=A0A1R2BZS1_9CILI|nr:hypothetical protein SteCoe_17088 [Stentor coeruleus]